MPSSKYVSLHRAMINSVNLGSVFFKERKGIGVVKFEMLVEN